jgi:hypothetical protein
MIMRNRRAAGVALVVAALLLLGSIAAECKPPPNYTPPPVPPSEAEMNPTWELDPSDITDPVPDGYSSWAEFLTESEQMAANAPDSSTVPLGQGAQAQSERVWWTFNKAGFPVFYLNDGEELYRTDISYQVRDAAGNVLAKLPLTDVPGLQTGGPGQ